MLIVDDAEELREVLTLFMERAEGLEVVGEAVDGLDGVEKARDLQPDVVILDIAMPRMDGLQALPLIREASPGARVVILSGFGDSTMAEDAMRAGADHYVQKGGRLSELVTLVEAL
ncbi:response regulator transcription factor [Nocardioides sp. Soil774]|uniref:response regulator transcription factor n=1 Tax=Nocardioides sp. Soil774 TaxID=1736408 RepID=UPI00138F8254|nr:response regulator transcription factor [Nocardioides sp. Soil774]